MPAGMVEVTRREFFAAVMAENRNIHPTSRREWTEWVLVHEHRKWGWCSHGYSNTQNVPLRYGIATDEVQP